MSIIDDHPVSALIEPFFNGNGFGNKEQMSDELAVCYRNTVNIGYMFFRNNENMYRRLGIEVLKGNSMIIFMDDLCGYLFFYDLAEDAVRISGHFIVPPVTSKNF